MPQSRNVVEGSDITVNCDVSDRQHIVFQWMFRGKIVVNTSRRFQDNSNLRILRVNRDDDDGPFTCIATNITTGFSLQSSNAKLNIQCKYYSFVFGNSYSFLFKLSKNSDEKYFRLNVKAKVALSNDRMLLQKIQIKIK